MKPRGRSHTYTDSQIEKAEREVRYDNGKAWIQMPDGSWKRRPNFDAKKAR
jgi:hypothetical protein